MVTILIKHFKYLFARPEIMAAIVGFIEAGILFCTKFLFGKKDKYSNQKGKEYVPGESIGEQPSKQSDTIVKKQKRKCRYRQFIEGTAPEALPKKRTIRRTKK